MKYACLTIIILMTGLIMASAYSHDLTSDPPSVETFIEDSVEVGDPYQPTSTLEQIKGLLFSENRTTIENVSLGFSGLALLATGIVRATANKKDDRILHNFLRKVNRVTAFVPIFGYNPDTANLLAENKTLSVKVAELQAHISTRG